MIFLILLLAIGVQRIAELKIAASNVANLRERGAVEYGAEHYPFMVLLHGFWVFSMLLEWWSAPSSLPKELIYLGWLALCLGQALRWSTIRTLGERWTTRILVLPGAAPIAGGPFRFFRHPNYVGVCLEIFGLPLIGGCWRTSLVFGALNLLLLKVRVSVEEQALIDAVTLFETTGEPS